MHYKKNFFETLPILPETKSPEEADIAWLIYDLKYNDSEQKYNLEQEKIVYTKFKPALDEILTPKVGNVDEFINILQNKLDDQLDEIPPDAPTLSDINDEG